MDIKYISADMKKIDYVDGMIVEAVYAVKTAGGKQTPDKYSLTDESGHSIQLTIWPDGNCPRLKKGDRVTVYNAYAKEYRGEVSLNLSQYPPIGSVKIQGEGPLQQTVEETTPQTTETVEVEIGDHNHICKVCNLRWMVMLSDDKPQRDDSDLETTVT